LESIKEEWACETGPDNHPLSDNRQRNCILLTAFLKKQVDISIKLWKNGFTVNDDFRSYSDGASQQFLYAIKKGWLDEMLTLEEVDL
ncbi:UBX domain-containing protein 2A, partial [Heterocephalus glaber]